MNEKPTHLDLFSGIGGFALAARRAGFRTIGFCEIDKYCQRVLAKNFIPNDSINGCGSRRTGRPASMCERQSEQALQILADAAWNLRAEQTASGTNGERAWPRCYSDIRKLDGGNIGCNVTLLTGGFPCQPFSLAGKRRGKADDRHLWPEMLRVIKEARPAWVLGENVVGIIGMELDTVLSDLETIGYTTRPFVIPACGVDARHRRNRVWIVGHAICSERRSNVETGGCLEQGFDGQRETPSRISESGEDVADAEEQLGERSERNGNATGRNGSADGNRWEPEPDVGRVAHGIPARVDRLRGLGNAIVPQVAYQIMRAIMEQCGAGTNPAPKNQ